MRNSPSQARHGRALCITVSGHVTARDSTQDVIVATGREEYKDVLAYEYIGRDTPPLADSKAECGRECSDRDR